MQVPFGEWLPDQPEHLKQGANVATNVYHAANTYKRFPSLVAYSTNNVGKNAKGAGSFRDNSNNIYNFVATKTDIYQLASGTFTSRKGSLTGGEADFFTFTQFGNYVIASNGIDPQQVQNWLQMYATSMERCENNDKQDSYGSAPVHQRTDVQTDLSFYRTR